VINLFPREETFLPQFTQAASVMLDAARALDELAGNFTDVEVKTARIKHLEHEGDQIAHHTFNLLSRTWITPIDREDIHSLAGALDDVLDSIDAVATRFVLFKISGSTSEVKGATSLIVQSVEAIQKAVPLLGDMKNSKTIIDACVEINRLENEADSLFRIAISRLFDMEKDPIQILKWKEIYEVLEETTDRCEDVANVLEQIVLKSS
jgi:predicted phosphate transport protein (TIGR00153 family)